MRPRSGCASTQRACIHVALYRHKTERAHLVGAGKLPMHTCDWEILDQVTAVTANHSGYMTQMPASSQHLEALKGPEVAGRG